MRPIEAELHAASGGRAERLFALFDAARIPGLPVLLQKLDVPHSCLFRGEVKEDIARVAPYVVRLRFASIHYEWLDVRADDVPSILFGISDASGSEVFTHLRRFLLVHSPEGQQRFFRFYDPRVLGPFLSASTEAEKQQFFGPVSKILAWDAKGRRMEWAAPPPPAQPIRYPDAHYPFGLRPEHEAAFSQAALSRYDERLVRHLRQKFYFRLDGVTDEQLQQVAAHARDAAPALGITSGRDITCFAEILIAGFTPQLRAELLDAPPSRRSGCLAAIRDRLLSPQPA